MRKAIGASFTLAVLYLLVAVAHGDQKRVATAATGNPFIQNGDFEDVKIVAPFMSKNPADVPGWTHSYGDPGDALIWRIGYADGGAQERLLSLDAAFSGWSDRYRCPSIGITQFPRCLMTGLRKCSSNHFQTAPTNQ